EVTWLHLLGGILVALVITGVFYLPTVILTDRINPWRLAVYFAKLLFDIAHASIQVAWLALGPSYTASNAIVAVHLRTRNDLITTWVGVSTSIVPGSIVVDIDRVQSILYLHVLNVRSRAEADAFVQSVLATERRVVAAAGTSAGVAPGRQAMDGSGHDSETRTPPRQTGGGCP